MLKYSTFALNDMEKETGHVLLCRCVAYSDMAVELLNYDEELLSKAIAVKTYEGRIAEDKHLTQDIRGIRTDLSSPTKFWAGQYVDVTVTTEKGETITRSFSMANTPDETESLSFIIKKYPEGKFSGELDSGGIRIGAKIAITGPYGTCFRRDGREGPLILVAAGSGMSPIWSILNDHLASGEDRPVYFFYGARTRDDLFYLDQIAALTDAHPEVMFVPVLSHADDDASWDGARGFVHERVDDRLKELDLDGQGDVYACGPPPMIDALQPVLFMNGFDMERIFFDRFTTSTSAQPELVS
ncbi:hypothetical protein COL154_013977 [Colletotrichum chrysophilum]|nr:hypothetical protein COL154_013977 [Colletotrichum chrysophilum]